MTDPNELLDVARETIGKVQFCFVATVGVAGVTNVRVVEPFALGDDWSVAFVTSGSSRKADEIERNGRLTLAYQHAPGRSLRRARRTCLDRRRSGGNAGLLEE